ncbi:hypothetical protein [Nocardia abscessus]|uniref:hypothetical protein n=1 Tax=Nocardia abscessus TaxID=120957 RepID=UPI0012F987C8|nr:hypothetical protein [Nocardia abscessus]MCC3331597.1 hypothetical protein [Nocardia abscessus]
MGNKSGWAAWVPKLAAVCLAAMPVLAVGMALVGFREGALQFAIIPLAFIGIAVFFGYAFALASISESSWSLILAIFIAVPVLLIGPIAVQVALQPRHGSAARRASDPDHLDVGLGRRLPLAHRPGCSALAVPKLVNTRGARRRHTAVPIAGQAHPAPHGCQVVSEGIAQREE